RVFKVPFIMVATYWDPELGQSGPSFLPEHDAEFFTKLLDGFGGNPTGTMTEFWLENSYGQLKVDVDVFGPYTSYRSLQDRCYYGGIEAPDDPLDDLDPVDSQLGVGGGGVFGMAAESVSQADLDINWGEYDSDDDGYVDFTGFIHSGPDMAATGDPCHTWSHAGTVSDLTSLPFALAGVPAPAKIGIPTLDVNAAGMPVQVDRIFTMPEINADIGVAVHEMMHALGEPDYYDTSYSSMGTGDWDIMAGGSWFGNPPGSNPIGANPATKVFQGWLTPTVVHGDLRNVKLAPRERVPSPGYNVTKVDPNILLIPLAWTDSTEPADVYGLVKDPKNGKYITEGWYVENLSRSVTGAPDLSNFKRSPYFDRMALSSGIMIWHFDYYKKSNTYEGANNAQTDPNRPQMDPEEFDFNDNTQELQLGRTRGEPSDLWFGAATGMTSATRHPFLTVLPGKPDASLSGSGVVVPTQTATYDFTVSNSPGNYRMRASLVGEGDCILTLLYKDGDEYTTAAGPVDGGFVGDEEITFVINPSPGEWRLEVGDFLACTSHEWNISFTPLSAETIATDTLGAADTWSNPQTDEDGNVTAGKPTGWAITNIGPKAYEGWEHAADAGGSPTISLDVLNLDKTEVDVSPGFAASVAGGTFAPLPLNVGRGATLEVPVYNNGGKAAKNVVVSVKTLAGQAIGTKTIDSLAGYERRVVKFAWTPAQEGPTHVVVSVDPSDTIAEAHEGNNVQRTRLLVGPADPTVLIVDDDGSFDPEDTYAGALTALGVPFAVAQGSADATTMKAFDAVIWEAGLERYQGQLNRADRDAIRAYLDAGGRFWYVSPRAAAALGEGPGRTNPGGGTAEMIGLLRDYFGAKYVDTQQVGGGIVKGLGDAIGGKAAIKTDVFPGRPLQDVLDVDTSRIGKATKVLDWEKGPAIGTKVVGDANHKSFRSVYFGFNLSQVLDGDDQVALTKQVLTWLGVKLGTYTPSTPVLYHTQVRSRIAKQATTLAAYVFGADGPVKVLYRAHGVGDWQELAMKAGGTKGLYEATIPSVWSTLRGLDYVIVAGKLADPQSAPALAHYIGVAPPEAAAPAVLGKKFTVARGSTGSGSSSGAPLPATGVGGGLIGMLPIMAAGATAMWLRRRRLT
ncbi:MAG: immune inhibitor A domain-containing protein, partial [Actinomycetota bacterium]